MAGVWTNNWRGVKNAMLIGAFVPGLSTVKDANGSTITHLPPSVNLDGSRCDFVLTPMGPHRPGSVTALYGGYGACVVLGDGTGVSPAATDYTLGHLPSVNYLSVSSDSLSVDTVNGSCSRHFTAHLKNNGSAAITLTEWGVFVTLGMQRVDDASNYSRSLLSNYGAMVYHATLDSPFPLAAGESAAIELTLTLTLDDPI